MTYIPQINFTNEQANALLQIVEEASFPGKNSEFISDLKKTIRLGIQGMQIGVKEKPKD